MPKNHSHKELPIPSDEAILHSQQLSKQIRIALARHKTMTFAQYMQKTLYTPNLGYYTNGLTKIGAQGDFITAPEISPIFSRCLAKQAQQVLQILEEANIIEFGAGRGIMARDILLELQTLNQPIKRYCIIELSAELQQRQKETLQTGLPPELFQKVTWLNQLPSTPISAVIFANEVLDAMPFERLRIEPQHTLRGHVRYNEQKEKFEWDYQPITNAHLQQFANRLIQHIGEVSELGYHTEINLHIKPWLESLNNILSQGAVILIDYGYPREEYYQSARVMGTLRCHYQHRAHQNPFFYPGLQDITAHVDFTAVAEAGFESGFKVSGYTTQANFLMGSGLLEMSSDSDASVTEQLKIAQQIKTLTLPNEMGENFKVIALTKQCDLSLIGFSVRDLRHQL